MTRTRNWARTVLVLMLACAATGGATASASSPQSGPCVELTANASPPIVPPGDPVTISGSITNCSGQFEVVLVRARVSGHCGFDVSRKFQVALRGGQTLSDEFVVDAPQCEGIYRGRATASVNGTVLDRVEVVLKVCQDCQLRR